MGNRVSKVVTRTGDDGSTGLADGRRLPKHATRIEAVGEVDELNSQIGLLLTEPLTESVKALLLEIQNDLFDPGGELALPDHCQVGESHIQGLDWAIGRINAELPPLKEFVLPGGNRAAALAHVCRTVCRRAERRVTELAASEAISPRLIQYLNRLSDLLFVLARHLNRSAGNPEPLWRGPKPA